MARILLIDDDPSVREAIARQLAIDDHKVVEARNGEEGLKLFPTARFDVVITDLLMPGMDGIETIIAIRKIGGGIPVIAMSGGATTRFHGAFGLGSDFLWAAGRLGAAETIRKPFRHAELKALLDRLLGNAEPASVTQQAAGRAAKRGPR